jgi:ParB-like chromosome segregation protein Spo0J
MHNLKDVLIHAISGFQPVEQLCALNELRELLYDLSPVAHNPVDYVRWIPVEQIVSNDYNPNRVANVEMRLLAHSIRMDGYTQPIVTVYNDEIDKYEIVDGFHRYCVGKAITEMLERNLGCLPVVVIRQNANQRMASTIRHNRARGKHTTMGMSQLVFRLLEAGWEDAKICNELGMEPEELLKLKHITGFSKLFENIEYRRAWVSRHEIEARKQQQLSIVETEMSAEIEKVTGYDVAQDPRRPPAGAGAFL